MVVSCRAAGPGILNLQLRIQFSSHLFKCFLNSCPLRLPETVRRAPRGTEPLPQHAPTIELRHSSRSRSPHNTTPRRSPPEPNHPRSANEDPLQSFSQLPDSNHHLLEEMYPLSVSPAPHNGRCVTPKEAPCPGSPGVQEAGPPRVIQLMPSAIMNPLILSPNRSGGGAGMDFRHSRGGGPPSQVVLENGREGKLHLHHHQLAQLQQQQEELYRNHVIMPVSPPEEQQMPIGRIAGRLLEVFTSCCFSSAHSVVYLFVLLLDPCRLQAAVGLRLPAPVGQQVRELHPLGGSGQ